MDSFPSQLTPLAEPTYDVVWPKSPLGVQSKPLAARLDTLVGKRVGFVWDYMFRGEEIFPTLQQVLQERFAGLEVVGYETFGNIHGPDEAGLVRRLPDTLRHHRVDAVIVGNGC